MPHPAVPQVEALIEGDLAMLTAKGIHPQRIALARMHIGRILRALTFGAVGSFRFNAEKAKRMLIDLEMRCGTFPLTGSYDAIWRVSFVRGGRDHDFDALFQEWTGQALREETLEELAKEFRRAQWEHPLHTPEAAAAYEERTRVFPYLLH